MYARMTKFVGLPPERIDQALDEFKQGELAELENQPGFEGIMVLVDRTAGTAAALSLWHDEAAMKTSERTAERARQSAVATTKPERFPVVDHFEVVLQRMGEVAAA
jgi:heme-degrading monooxygenase HmoA